MQDAMHGRVASSRRTSMAASNTASSLESVMTSFPCFWKLNITLPGSATLQPSLVMMAFTSLAVRLRLSVRQSTMKPVPPGPYAS